MTKQETPNLPPFDEFATRRLKRQALLDKGINPYVHSYEKKQDIGKILGSATGLEPEKLSQLKVSTAGRIIAKRGHGKASFGNICDESGKIQIYFKQDVLGDEKYALSQNLDVGDIVGVSGELFITHTGELTIKIQDFVLLSKALNPLPEKYHGLHDKELRYRKRYLDLIANPDVKDIFSKRSKIMAFIRKFLTDLNFIEVETPVLHTLAGGASAKPFITYHNALDMNLYLRIALELHLKRLIVGGFEKVFEIGRVFRNEGISFKHNPEYTLLELYQAYADYNDMMSLMENLLSALAKEITGEYKIKYGDNELDFTPPFPRFTMQDIVKKHSGIDIIKTDFKGLTKLIKEKHIEIPDNYTSKGQLINLLYDKLVEPKLIQPTFVIDYPAETSPLAKRHRKDDSLVERFELIVNSLEIANAFSELNDPIDQRQRFEDQLKQREAGDEEAHMMDNDFVESLEYGMPPTGGLGIGIDRVVMLLTNSPSIRDVIFFPHLKHKPLPNE
ncbi:MAG: lysine--tRNA ligase [Candidatus Margulisbacteria bacterium]|nr:lysine--tRNA ligase [Candidatus Margulisiibacteriota bacterium]